MYRHQVVRRRPLLEERGCLNSVFKNSDTIDLEQSTVTIQVRRPNGELLLQLDGIDPRKDSLEDIKDALSDKYYHGKNKR